jgi:transposase
VPRKSYRSWQPHQSFLLPPSPDDWLAEGHLAYFILEVVEALDLSAVEDGIHAKDARGVRPYHPRMMVGLLLYAYSVGVFSSRRIARATREDVAFRVICGGDHPHFTRIGAFRRTHRVALEGLFLQVLKLCQRAGLVKLGHVAIDGTKIQGNASKHKAMSYKRMQEQEVTLKAEIEGLLARADSTDADEDARFGTGQDEVDIPAELRRREDRLRRIQQAKTALEEEARRARATHERELAADCRARAQTTDSQSNSKLNTTIAAKHDAKAAELDPEHDDDNDDPPFTTPSGLPKHRPESTADGMPNPKAQRNFTDPESRIMESGGQFLQGYNCQAAVDDERQIIVGQSVTNQPPDAGNLAPMLDIVAANMGSYPDNASADAGYWCEQVEEQCNSRCVHAMVSTRRKHHHEQDDTPTQKPPPEGLTPKERMRWLMRDPERRALYARRKVIVEPVFGQTKEVRGFRRFLLRGLEKVTLEWSLLCTTHNLLKLHRAHAA